MDLSELDRLAESVKLALEKIDRLQVERSKLDQENKDLKNRLRRFTEPQPKPTAPQPPPISADRIADIKTRLNTLIERINDLEHRL